MNKLIVPVLILATSLALSACGGDSNSASSDNAGGAQVSLSWIAPTTRTDGSALPFSELRGYRIYYGTTASSLSVLADINDYTITEYALGNLPSGTYYFAVTAYDGEGNESGMSNVISKNI